MNITFTMELDVHDEEALRLAAAARAVYEGMALEEWQETRVDTTDDIVMLLDPGLLAGCSIVESRANFESED